MKISRVIAVMIVCVFCYGSSNAQQWMQKDYFDPNKSEVSFYDIENAFAKWSSERNMSEVRGWKPYKRWEWFYGTRLYPSGQIPSARIYMNELKKYDDKYGFLRSKGASNWVSLSPANVPPAPDTNSIHGMGRINCLTFHPTNPDVFWIGASQGGVWKTTDGGQNWTPLTDELPLLRISDIAVDPLHPDTMYIATGDIDYVGFNTIAAGRYYQFGHGILKSVDGGISWDTTGLSYNLQDGQSSLIRKIVISPQNTQVIMAAGVDGVYKSLDGGDNWVKTDSNVIIDLEPNPKNYQVLYASTFWSSSISGSKAIVLKTTDFGDTWTELASGIPKSDTVQRIELAIAPSDTSIVYALTCGMNEGFYALYKTEDAGASWTQTASTQGANKIPNVLGWADGGYFGFPGLPVDDAGQGTYDLTLIVDPDSAHYVFTGGVNMWGSTNGGVGGTGNTWNVVTMWLGYFGRSVHADQHCSKFHPLTGEFFQCSDGGIFKTDSLMLGDLDSAIPCFNITTMSITPGCYYLPTQWTDLSHGLHITEYYRLGLSRANSDLAIAGSQDNGTYLYDNGSWINTWNGDGMEAMMDHDNPNIMFATNYSGALSRSMNGGQTYTSELESPITGAGEHGDWVTPYIMHPNRPEIIYTAFYNVWVSPDRGSSWSKLSNWLIAGYPFKALTVATTSSDHIYCSKPGFVGRTKNGGQNWQNISSGLPINLALNTYLYVNHHNPEIVYATFAGYEDGKKVYRSFNAGDTWENISHNLPNLPANCIVHQAGRTQAGDTLNGLYVGTDVGIYYTNDSLLNTASPWIPFDNGLPNVVVSELEIQYDAQKIVAATYGRGLWESPLYADSYGLSFGVEDNTFKGQLEVYPNPTDGQLMVSGSWDNNEKAVIKVFNLMGEKLMEKECQGRGYVEEKLILSVYGKGIYFIRVENGNAHFTQKVIVQ